MLAFGASDPGSNPDGTTIHTVAELHICVIYREGQSRPDKMMRLYTTENGKITPAESICNNVWIRLSHPTDEEISVISKTLNIDVTDINASLDKDEGSRIEMEDDLTTILVDIPYDNSGLGTSSYNTIPFAILRSKENIITVCQMDSEILEKYSANVNLNDKTEFVLKLLNMISLEYQRYLRNINNRRREIEKNLDHSTKDKDIIELHQLESSLVYFSTSLRAYNVVLSKMRRYGEIKMDEAHFDMLHDVIIENEQAIEMATIYGEVIDGTRELFVAVMNNKLNDVLKWLTSVTILLSIPMIVSGIYGMNVNLPLMNDVNAFIWILMGTLLLCTIGAIILRKKDLL